MIRKKYNFYVKKMQKLIIVVFGVLGMAIFSGACTKKEEAHMMLLTLEEESETAVEAEVKPEQFSQSESASNESFVAQPLQEETKKEIETESETQPVICYVHVCGAVMNPGVYEFESECRVYEAVARAGGFTEDAAEDYVNQAQTVPDAAKLVIPTIKEVEDIKEDGAKEDLYGILLQQASRSGVQERTVNLSGATSGFDLDGIQTDSESDGIININTANKAQLCTLSGIGELKANAIIDYRTRIGCFTTKEQIMEVEGIKEGLYSKIENQICVE